MKKAFPIRNFNKGVVNSIEDKSLPIGAMSDEINFITNGDRVELRRGQKVMGTELLGNGKITGLHTGYLYDGTQLLFATFARKIKYFDEATQDLIEIGTNSLPLAASGEDISFTSYQTLAGAMVYLSSPNSSLYKIMTANPGNLIDLYDATKNYKGYIKIKTNSMWLWNRNEANSVFYRSYIDTVVDNKTDVTSEAIGVLGSITYTGTLAFKAGGAKRVCFAVVFSGTVAAGTETFTDDYKGNLTGNLGGTGTINYATGAYSVTFSAITTGAVTADYSYYDDTNKGVADFTFSATRAAGEGDFLQQGDGSGKSLSIEDFGSAKFCFHERKTWKVNISDDDMTASNTIYRENVGIPNWRAAIDTGDGIYYIDDVNNKDVKVRKLDFASGSTEIIPVDKSDALDLSTYLFDKAASIRWGDYVIFSCRRASSTENDRVLLYNTRWNSWDILDYTISCFAIYNGALIGGDSISNNIIELFSGTDDYDTDIPGYIMTGDLDLGIEALKKDKELWINGRIQKDQNAKVYVSYDGGAFVEVGEIDGQGDYVDGGTAITVGASIVGKLEVGGGGSSITAYNYWRKIKVNSDKFKRLRIKIAPTKTGWFDVTEIQLFDIRIKQQKLIQRYN